MGKKWNQVIVKEDEEQIKVISKYRDKYLYMCLLMGENDSYFFNLKKNLYENRILGRDEYPNTIQYTYEMILNTQTGENIWR